MHAHGEVGILHASVIQISNWPYVEFAAGFVSALQVKVLFEFGELIAIDEVILGTWALAGWFYCYLSFLFGQQDAGCLFIFYADWLDVGNRSKVALDIQRDEVCQYSVWLNAMQLVLTQVSHWESKDDIRTRESFVSLSGVSSGARVEEHEQGYVQDAQNQEKNGHCFRCMKHQTRP